ncbi:AAA family ATPase [Streptomyces cellostaticus]|uniref:AAA family ATPase n=1 Tax=Streptomyces cellostaticus TaxID=67285 RepID=UPI0020267C7A|nr:AAA family ATPase [Streptomyces cellostaticus]
MLIEICGPDGAGKTTLVDALRARLRAATGVAVYERVLRSESRNLLEVARLSASASFTQREMTLAVLLDAVRQSTGEFSTYVGSPVMHIVVQHYAHTLAARLRDEGLHLDPGLRWLLSRLPPPDVSVRLAITPTRCMERIRARAKGDDILTAAEPGERMRRLVESFENAAADLTYPQFVVDAAQDVPSVLKATWWHVQAVAGVTIQMETGYGSETGR